jgi:autotransporter-associated beta strand protein
MKSRPNLFKRLPATSLLPSCAVICIGASAFPLHAADNLWSNTGTTEWNTAGNWSLGRVPVKVGFSDEAVINTNTGSIATISSNLSDTPAGIIIGHGPSTNGRLDHTAGTAATGGGNWMKIGHNGGTGVYNLADTAGSGGTFSGFAQGTGNMTVNGHLRVGGGDAGSGGNGTVNMNTSGTLAVTSELHVGTDASTGVFNLDQGALTISDWVYIGNGASGGNSVTGTLNMSGGTLTKTGGNNFRVGSGGGNGFLNISGGTLTNNNEFQIADGAGTDGTVTLSGSGTINTNSWLSIGRSTGTGILNVNGGTLNKTNGGTAFIVGDGSTGTLNQTNGTITSNGEFWIASGTSTGSYNMSGGTLNTDSWFVVGRNSNSNGVLTMTGGTINNTGTGSDFVVGGESATASGTVVLSGGLINATGRNTSVGKNNGTGIVTISGTAEFRTNTLALGEGLGNGTVNLNGGTLKVSAISGGNGTSTVRFNGGTLQAAADSATFISGLTTAEIQSGGALIDTQGFTVTASQDLSGGGALVKSGSGTLILTGNSTHTGPTLVSAGTLLVNGSIGSSATTVSDGATIGGSGGTVGALTVNSGGFLAAGNSIGALTAASADIDGTLRVEYDGTGAGTIDLLTVMGNLDITNATVDFSQLGASADDGAYVFASYGTLTGSAFANIENLPLGGYYIDYAFDNGISTNNIALVIPEPTAPLLGGIGLIALLRRRRK